MSTNIFYKRIVEELDSKSDKKQAEGAQRFFKCSKGGYGEGDLFLGVSIPEQRVIAKKYYKEISLEDTLKLMQGKYHEQRMIALFILVEKYNKAKTEGEKETIYKMYLDNTKYVNNWDLVDSSAQHIVGKFLLDKKDRTILYTLAKSGDLWKQRISIIATLTLIRNQQYNDTLQLAELFLHHKHDLIHKSAGWMLREVGNRDIVAEEEFLHKHYKSMPRTMLRYAIEKLPKDKKDAYMKGTI